MAWRWYRMAQEGVRAGRAHTDASKDPRANVGWEGRNLTQRNLRGQNSE